MFNPDSAQMGITYIFHDFKVMFIQLNEATNHTVYIPVYLSHLQHYQKLL